MLERIVSYNPVFISGSNYYVECIETVQVCQSPAAWSMYDRGIGDVPSGGKKGREKTFAPVIHPVSTKLVPPYPNPFNPVARIRFEVSASAKVTIKIIDVLGRHIETLISSQFNPGEHSVTWNAGSHPSGTYFVELTADQYSSTQKIVLIK